jgi:hypothetical protein
MGKRIARPLVLAALLGFVAGVLWLGAIRFVTYRSDAVHYHANFALYVNGKRDPFKSFTFYEEVNACASDELDNPKTRVHMHNQNGGLVHVHAHATTWGQFFDNLGYTLGDTVLKTDDGVYVTNVDGNKLTFTLNGKPVDTVANRLIQSEDKLLINYGQDSDATLRQRSDQIPRDAAKANTENDPSTCSGSHKLTLRERLWHAVGIDSKPAH